MGYGGGRKEKRGRETTGEREKEKGGGKGGGRREGEGRRENKTPPIPPSYMYICVYPMRNFCLEHFYYPNPFLLCHVPGKYLLKAYGHSLCAFFRYCRFLFFRLEAYDRNHNFGQPDLIEPDYYKDVPDASLYKDVNSDTKFGDFSIDTVVYYLQQYDKELDLKTSKEFYQDTMLRYFRLATENDKMYIKRSC